MSPEVPNGYPQDRTLTGLFLLFAFLLACTPVRSFDIWWSLRAGQLILERGVVPKTDWFTYTEPDGIWIDLHWGFQVFIAFVHRYWGLAGLVFAKSVSLTLMAWFCWHTVARRLPSWAVAACWLCPLLIVSGRIMERAEMVSFVCLAAWFWTLSRAETQPSAIWCLPGIQLIWTNCHGLFSVGWVVGTFWLVDILARHLVNGRLWLAPPPLVGPFRAVLCWLAFSSVSLINPYGLDGFKLPYDLWKKMSSDYDFYSVRISEFMPVTTLLRQLKHPWSDLYLDLSIVLTLATLISVIALIFVSGRMSIFRILLFVAFFLLAMKFVRNLSLLGIAYGYILSANVKEYWDFRLRRREVNPAETGFGPGESSVSRLAWGARVLIGSGVICVLTGWWAMLLGAPQLRLSFRELPNHFPHAAARFAGQDGMPVRCYASGIGPAALYVYHNGPERQIFLDGRLESASRDLYQRYEAILLKMRDGNQNWIHDLRQESAELPAILLYRASAPRAIENVARTPGWRAVYADHLAVVIVEDAVAERLHLPQVDISPKMPSQLRPQTESQ